MGETAKERREALVGRKSRRASDWPHGHRWIAPDLSRVAWLGSCRKSTIKRTGLENADRSSDGVAPDRAYSPTTRRSTKRLRSDADMRD